MNEYGIMELVVIDFTTSTNTTNFEATASKPDHESTDKATIMTDFLFALLVFFNKESSTN